MPERGVYLVYDAIVDRGPATTVQLAKATRLATSAVVQQGHLLVRLGLVQFRGEGAQRVWRTTDAATGRDAA